MIYIPVTIQRRARIIVCCAFVSMAGPAAHAQATTPDSAAIEHQIDSLLPRLTIEEKLDLLGGVDHMYTHAIPSIGWPSFKMSDGPMGVETWGQSTAYATGIGLAAAWDTTLAYDIGSALGRDARARGVRILLAPGVNIYRAPMGGRNFEYLGEDPFLASRTAVAFILGVQSKGVSATVKHFMGNNSEYDRHNTSSDIAERTMREIYLPAFEAAVKDAHVGALMDSYNLVNGVHATQNALLNDTIAKGEWKFNGLLMSDWRSTYNGVAAANAGLDLEMPWGRHMARDTLLPAIHNGAVSMATIDDKVRRLMRTALRFGFLNRPEPDDSISLNDLSSRAVALRSALEGTVLLKNTHGLLPLNAAHIHTIAVIGPDASPTPTSGGGSALMVTFQAKSILTGVGEYLRDHHTAGTPMPNVLYARGLPLATDIYDSTKFQTDTGAHAAQGLRQEQFNHLPLTDTPFSTSVVSTLSPETATPLPVDTSNDWRAVRWTGVFVPPKTGDYLLLMESQWPSRLKVNDSTFFVRQEPEEAQVQHSYVLSLVAGHAVHIKLTVVAPTPIVYAGLGIHAMDDLVTPETRRIAKAADAVILAVGYDSSTETEASDRTFELPWGQNALIKAVAAENPRTIVTVTSGGNVAMSEWLDQVPAVLFNWYAGQEGGTALAELLFGAANPEGKLPATFERRWEDNPTHDSYYPTSGIGTDEPHVQYTEGVLIGYRGYTPDKPPLFPFGFGLSYTTFAFAHLSMTPLHTTAPNATVTVAFDVTNTGHRTGAEVAQVYVGDPSAKVKRPAKELKGFAKVRLQPGETRHVVLTLNRRAFAYWDTTGHQWRIDPGAFNIYVGDASDRTPLSATVALEGQHWSAAE